MEVVGLVGGKLGTGGERAWSEKPAEPLWWRGVVVVGGAGIFRKSSVPGSVELLTRGDSCPDSLSSLSQSP